MATYSTTSTTSSHSATTQSDRPLSPPLIDLNNPNSSPRGTSYLSLPYSRKNEWKENWIQANKDEYTYDLEASPNRFVLTSRKRFDYRWWLLNPTEKP